MSLINVDTIESRTGGPPTLSKGVVVSAAATFSGAVSIAGTLTYEDVTNVDVIGIVTARSGIKLGAAGIGGTFNANGDTTLAGVVTATSFVGDGTGLTGMANTANVSTTGLNVVGGVSTFNNNVTLAAGNLDVDAGQLLVGSGITIGPAGVATFSDGSTSANSVRFGNEGDLSIYHDGSTSNILNTSGTLNVGANNFVVKRQGLDETMLYCQANAAVSIYYDNVIRLNTTSSGAITTGIHTVTVGTDLDGYKVEEGSYDTDVLNGEFDFELENGHVQTHTGSTGGTYFPDFRVSSSQSLDSVMDVGDVISCTLIVSASNASHYCTTGIKIDNSTSNITLEWIGSSAPSAGKGAGFDIYSFTIQKTAATPAYLIIGNATDAG